MLGLGGTYAPLHERVSYDPYGKAMHRWAGDVNDDGAVNEADADAVKNATGNAIGDPGYDVRMDFNRDGVIDDDDKDLAVAAEVKGGWPGPEACHGSSSRQPLQLSGHP